jgi:CO/xanthine dehydrogenase Mo-binding subunit
LWRTAAVSNELYDAIGAPVRDAPMTLDKLVSGLPPL